MEAGDPNLPVQDRVLKTRMFIMFPDMDKDTLHSDFEFCQFSRFCKPKKKR